jgi:ribosomal protein L15
VPSISEPIKILGEGEITKNGLIFEGLKISQSAKDKIIKAKGIIK